VSPKAARDKRAREGVDHTEETAGTRDEQNRCALERFHLRSHHVRAVRALEDAVPKKHVWGERSNLNRPPGGSTGKFDYQGALRGLRRSMQAKLLNHFLPMVAVNSLGLVRRGLARGRGHVVLEPDYPFTQVSGVALVKC